LCLHIEAELFIFIDYESKGNDRPDMRLPEVQNLLASAVLEVNQKTIGVVYAHVSSLCQISDVSISVVVQSGAPVEMPWADQVNSILQAFYGGNEVGNGIADVLFGKVH
jgi:beta-glucosidase